MKHGGVPVCAADGGGVYMQQYGGIQFNGVNYGKAAVLINTSSATTFTIAADWFSGSPITSYSYQLSLSGGEATCLPYNGVNAGDGGTHCATNNNILIKTCTNTKYCNGSQTCHRQHLGLQRDGDDRTALRAHPYAKQLGWRTKRLPYL